MLRFRSYTRAVPKRCSHEFPVHRRWQRDVAVKVGQSSGRPDVPPSESIPPPPLPPPPPPPPPPSPPTVVSSSSQKWRITRRDLIAASIGAVIGGSVMYTVDAVFAEYLFDVDALKSEVYADEYGPMDVPPNLEPYMSRFRQAPPPMYNDPGSTMQPAYPPVPGEYAPRGMDYQRAMPSAGLYPGMAGSGVPRYQDVPDLEGQWSRPVMSQTGEQDGNSQPPAP